jgi:hypothetical protein
MSQPPSQPPASVPPPETYIGDGLYASFDGIAIKLRAPRLVDGVEVNHEVYLEVNAYVELLRFAAGKNWNRLGMEDPA